MKYQLLFCARKTFRLSQEYCRGLRRESARKSWNKPDLCAQLAGETLRNRTVMQGHTWLWILIYCRVLAAFGFVTIWTLFPVPMSPKPGTLFLTDFAFPQIPPNPLAEFISFLLNPQTGPKRKLGYFLPRPPPHFHKTNFLIWLHPHCPFPLACNSPSHLAYSSLG